MCTLIALHRCVPGRPLVVAANRDEFLDRPSEGPAIRETRVGRILAPLDRRAGGTWLGLNERGVFVALTNLRAESPDPGRRSRGEVVLDALGAASAAEAARTVSQLEPEATNPFNLFVADEREALVVVHRDRPLARALEAGVHVVGNVEATGPGNEKVKRIRGEVETALAIESTLGAGLDGPGEGEGSEKIDLLDRLATICRHHGGRSDASSAQHGSRHGEFVGNREPLGDTCVHLEGTSIGSSSIGAPYGTRSSLLLELEAGFQRGRLLHADGPPCTTAYEDVSSLLVDLGRRPGVGTAESLMRTAS